MNSNNNSGYVLITTLLLLLVLTIIGMAAMGTSSIENILSGNIRLREKNISKADAGVEMSTALIERAVRESDTSGFDALINPSLPATDPDYLPTELRSGEFDADGQDLTLWVDNQVPGGSDVSIDIDRMYPQPIPGSANIFGAGYLGLGKGSSKDVYVYYRVNATGTDLAASTAVVGTVYRYVPK